MTTASSCGIAPPASEVPAPRGTTGTPLRMAEGQHRGDLLRRRGQHHRQRQAAIGGQRIRLIGPALIGRGDQRLGRDQFRQAGDDLVAAGDDAGVGNGKGDG